MNVTCRMCGAPARLYLTGRWCDAHSPHPVQAIIRAATARRIATAQMAPTATPEMHRASWDNRTEDTWLDKM